MIKGVLVRGDVSAELLDTVLGAAMQVHAARLDKTVKLKPDIGVYHASEATVFRVYPFAKHVRVGPTKALASPWLQVFISGQVLTFEAGKVTVRDETKLFSLTYDMLEPYDGTSTENSLSHTSRFRHEVRAWLLEDVRSSPSAKAYVRLTKVPKIQLGLLCLFVVLFVAALVQPGIGFLEVLAGMDVLALLLSELQLRLLSNRFGLKPSPITERILNI